jgi:hypothetical protein
MALKQTKIRSVIVFSVALGALVFESGCHYLLTGIRAANQAAAVGSIETIQKCAQEYSSTHPDLGYPDSIALLGPSGTNCIDGKLVARGGRNYNITYTPGVKNAEGRVETFVITANPVEYGRSGDSSYFSDETGEVAIREKTGPPPRMTRRFLDELRFRSSTPKFILNISRFLSCST